MSMALVTNNNKEDENAVVDCPICLNAMSISDISYPLVCPTANCNDFNRICLHCIQGMLQSEADGYQQASDGSHQVKFCVSCPACRTRYNPLATNSSSSKANNSNNNNKRGSPKSSPDYHDQSIIHHVILLRRVYAVQLLLDMNDSDLSATQLSLKHDFLQHTPDLSLQKIQDAAVLFIKYLKDIQKYETFENRIPKLDWAKLEEALIMLKNSSLSLQNLQLSTSNSNGSTNSSSNSHGDFSNNNKTQSQHPKNSQQQPWRDVTLFYGVLQDVMTVSEQEFLTQLFTSGQPDLVAQAAHIVHGILTMSMTQSLSNSTSTQSQSTSSSQAKKSTSTTTKKAAQYSPKKLAQLRGRFPLPQHMPLCVALPVYDPTSRSPLLSFEQVKKQQKPRNPGKEAEQPPPIANGSDNDKSNTQGCTTTATTSSSSSELIVARVHGPAGRLGLRRGDVVTHVQGGCEAMHNRADWDAHLLQLLQSSSTTTTTSSSSSSPTAANLSKNNSNNSLVTFVVVNANAQTANALKERALQMQRELKPW